MSERREQRLQRIAQRHEREEEERAAAEAAMIGGGTASEIDVDPAQRALIESGQGVAEGFELAEEDLIEHASHGDEHSARPAYHHRSMVDEEGEPLDGGEADHIRSSELEEEG